MRKTDEVASRSDGAGGEAVGSRGVMVLAVNNFGRVMMLERTWAPVVREDIKEGSPQLHSDGRGTSRRASWAGVQLVQRPCDGSRSVCPGPAGGSAKSAPEDSHCSLKDLMILSVYIDGNPGNVGGNGH